MTAWRRPRPSGGVQSDSAIAARATSPPAAATAASTASAFIAKCAPGVPTRNTIAPIGVSAAQVVASAPATTEVSRQSAPSPAPMATVPRRARMPSTSASAFQSAAPPGTRPSKIAAFSRAMPGRPSSNASRWTGASVVTSATSGRAWRASGAISPGWFMPISTTAQSASGGIAASVSGTPQWLL